MEEGKRRWAGVGALVLALALALSTAVAEESGPTETQLFLRGATARARMRASRDQELAAVIREGGPARHLSKARAPWAKALQHQGIPGRRAYPRSFCAPWQEARRVARGLLS